MAVVNWTLTVTGLSEIMVVLLWLLSIVWITAYKRRKQNV
jgi:hypothetical protein